MNNRTSVEYHEGVCTPYKYKYSVHVQDSHPPNAAAEEEEAKAGASPHGSGTSPSGLARRQLIPVMASIVPFQRCHPRVHAHFHDRYPPSIKPGPSRLVPLPLTLPYNAASPEESH